MTVRVGTSGFAYDFWKGSFYPADLKADQMLAFYGSQFCTVEINNTFYRMPKTEVLEKWAGCVPDDFRFVIKASKRITHDAKLEGCRDSVDYLYGKLAALGEKLGAVLFQCPPFLRRSDERLREFLSMLPARAQAVLEFRHPSWFCDDVFQRLRDAGVSLCVGEYEGKLHESLENGDTPLVVTAGLGYLRLREETYGDEALARWAARIEGRWAETYVFFKHEETAPEMVRRLQTHFD